MGFFDFLPSSAGDAGREATLNRLEQRRRFIVEPYVEELRGARVLDLASNDGRWSYALAAAGASEVVGIEARRELIEQFGQFPENEHKSKVSFIAGDFFEEIPRLIAAGEQFDVIAIYGVFYRIMNHYQLLTLVRQLEPRLVVIDSKFTLQKDSVITLRLEDLEQSRNTIAHADGQVRVPIGIVSRRALNLMARSLGYTVEWSDWATLPAGERQRLGDYFPDPNKAMMVRDTCALRPREM
jgi:Methyltransferase domain